MLSISYVPRFLRYGQGVERRRRKYRCCVVALSGSVIQLTASREFSVELANQRRSKNCTPNLFSVERSSLSFGGVQQLAFPPDVYSI